MADKTNGQVATGAQKPITKMEAVRRAWRALGKDAKPAQMKGFIKNRFGIDMTTDHISTC